MPSTTGPDRLALVLLAVIMLSGFLLEAVKHLLSVLHNEIGPMTIGRAVQKTYRGLKVAVHTGCHALRPSRITRFDNALVPMVFDDLVGAVGAESIYWSMKTECCGNPQWDKNRALALKQMHRKLDNARQSGADLVGTACACCQIQFNLAGGERSDGPESSPGLPAVLVSQLIGFSVGLNPRDLGNGGKHLGIPESIPVMMAIIFTRFLPLC